MRRNRAGWVSIHAAILLAPRAYADSWRLAVGAQSPDQSVQALAFLPNEIWIHGGDSIAWTFQGPDHSVTFLTPGQLRPTLQVGCPGTTPDGSTFDGSTCVNSGRGEVTSTTYTVTFPTSGNCRVVCLVHANMTGTVHVRDRSEPLPHGQKFYDAQARGQQLPERDGEVCLGELRKLWELLAAQMQLPRGNCADLTDSPALAKPVRKRGGQLCNEEKCGCCS